VTPYAPDECGPGNHPNQHEAVTAPLDSADRSIADTDVVLWHTFG